MTIGCEEQCKAEIFRMTDRRWMWFRALLLRENGHSWHVIGTALKRKESTVKHYTRLAQRENEFRGTLYYFLTTKSRTWLRNYDVDAKQLTAPERAADLMVWGQHRHGRDGRVFRLRGLGPEMRLEILNGIDALYESTVHRGKPAGE